MQAEDAAPKQQSGRRAWQDQRARSSSDMLVHPAAAAAAVYRARGFSTLQPPASACSCEQHLAGERC